MKTCLIAMEVLVPPSVLIPFRRCKKTRRGKKRKYEKCEDEEESGGDCKRLSPQAMSTSLRYSAEEARVLPLANSPRVEENVEPRKRLDNADHGRADPVECSELEEEESASVPVVPQANRRFLRPLDVPKAPSNSTQFIIDDHENCNLYFSFESPRTTSGHNKVSYEEQGYWDIDYEYESPDDVDTTAFFERDFEMIYNRAREEELLTCSRNDLIEQFADLEQRAAKLEDQLSLSANGAQDTALSESALMAISYFQEELFRLQEENLSLRRCNRNLLNRSGGGHGDAGQQ